MPPMTREAKLAKQTIEALSDVRFDPFGYGRIIASSEPYVQREVVQLLANTAELISINYDYGNFGKEELPYLRFCKGVARLLADQQVDPI